MTDTAAPEAPTTAAPAAPATPPSSSPAGFDADARARRRESAPVVIAEARYLPVKRTTDVMRDVRAIGREQERIGRQQERLGRQADEELYVRKRLESGEPYLEPREFESEEAHEAAEQRVEALNARSDELGDQATHATYRMLARLLIRESDRQHPDAGEIAAGLDVVEAEALSKWLMGEGDENPSTRTPATSD